MELSEISEWERSPRERLRLSESDRFINGLEIEVGSGFAGLLIDRLTAELSLVKRFDHLQQGGNCFDHAIAAGFVVT